jgi:type VI protein secretion system component VasK
MKAPLGGIPGVLCGTFGRPVRATRIIAQQAAPDKEGTMRKLIWLAVYGLIIIAIAALLASALFRVLTITDPLKTIAYTLLFSIIGLVIAVIVVMLTLFAARPRGNNNTNAGQQEEKPDMQEVQGKRKRGAPPLTERLDTERKMKLAQQYLEYIQQGKPKKTAAIFVGYHQRTLDRWVRDFGLTENDKK